MPTRRSFIKALSAATGIGALAVSGGRFPRPAAAATLPQAYAFTRLINSGDTLADGYTVDFLAGPVAINQTGKAVFYAKDSGGAAGLWEVDMDDPSQVRKVVRAGDELTAGTVERIITYDTNDLGSVAVLIQHSDGLQAAYVERSGGGLVQAVGFQQEVPGLGHKLGAHMQDLVLHTGDSMALVSYYNPEDGAPAQSGLFNFPSGEVDSQASLLLSSPALVHGQEGHVGTLGLSHVNDSGEYVVQAFIPHEGSIAASTGGVAEAPNRGVLIKGDTRRSQASGFATLSWPQYPKPGGPPPTGEIVYGPRIDGDGDPAYVVHITDSRMSLVIKDTTIISTGDLAPAGWAVDSMSPPNQGGGLYFFTLHGFTDQNEFQLIAHNGSEARVVLSMLDTVGDMRIINLVWGLHTEQADDSGRLAFLAEWDDQSTQSILMATPA